MANPKSKRVDVKIEDLIGTKIGKLTIIKEAEMKKSKRIIECQCECGIIKNILMTNIVNKRTNGLRCKYCNSIKDDKKILSLKQEIKVCLNCDKDELACNRCSISYRNHKIKGAI